MHCWRRAKAGLSSATAAIAYTRAMRTAVSESPNCVDAEPNRCANSDRSESFWRRYTTTMATAITAPTIAGSAVLTTPTSLAGTARSTTAPLMIRVAIAASPTPMTTAAVSDPISGTRGLRRRAAVSHVRDPRRRVWVGPNAHATKPPTTTAVTTAASTRTGSRPANVSAACRDTASRPRAQKTAHPAAAAQARTITATVAAGVFRISRGRRSAVSPWI
ncbi:MAG: hypothetical protein ACJ74F_10150 [Mycobacterium sp.]|uniref:hypothetical protein n=1 Tax=Mycobacterium sp. TaxID=1785 RepID=UPI00389A9348